MAKIGTDADGRPLLATTENVPGAVMQAMTTTWKWDGSRWKASRSDPQLDAGGNLAYDPYLNRVVALAGGITGSPYVMWGLDGNGWARLNPETLPSRGLYPASVVLDPVHRQLVALVPEQTTTSTWTFDGSTWAKAAATINPPARRYQEMAYDPATTTTVMYGGDVAIGGSSPLDDTWTWNGRAWTQQHPATTPGGCSAGQLAYDTAAGQMILFCVREQQARSGTFTVTTWAWTGTTWTQLPSIAMPPAAFTPLMTYDPVGQDLVLILGPMGGTTAFDAARRKLVALIPQTWTTSSTWIFDGMAGSQPPPEINPPARRRAGMAYDPASATIVLYGGERMGGAVLDDTWTWDGTTWTEQHPATTPGGCSGALAYDAAVRQMVLFCQRQQAPGSRNYSVTVWTWTGTTWTQLHPSTMPPAQAWPRMTYDSAARELVLFGTSVLSPGAAETWTYANGQWKRAA